MRAGTTAAVSAPPPAERGLDTIQKGPGTHLTQSITPSDCGAAPRRLLPTFGLLAGMPGAFRRMRHGLNRQSEPSPPGATCQGRILQATPHPAQSAAADANPGNRAPSFVYWLFLPRILFTSVFITVSWWKYAL